MAFQHDFVYLLKAIKEKKFIDIFYKEEYKTWNYSSRFLKLSSDGQSFIIDLPFMGEDTYKPLEIGFTIQIVYKLAGFRFQFAAEVQDRIQYVIDKEKKIPAIKISWPMEIIEENRRSFFRVELSLNESIKVTYTILGTAGEQGEQKPDAPDRTAEHHGVEAIVADVSENGIKIKINSVKKIKINDKLRLSFCLKELDDEYVEIDGIVRHICVEKTLPAYFCGVEFSKKDSLRHKQAVRKIIFYLMSKHQENVSFFSIDSIISRNPMVKRIVHGEVGTEVLNMLLDKEFRLSNEEYIESLSYVSNKKEYKTRALAILQSIPIPVKAKYIERMDANHQAAYCLLTEAVKDNSMDIITTALNNQYLPVEFWLKVAREGTEPMLALLLQNPNKLIAYPEILDVMTQNPGITPAIAEKSEKIENHYLEDVEPDTIPMEGLITEVQKVIKKQLKEKGEKINIFTTAKARMEAISVLKRINAMNIRERIRLAYCGSKPERMVLARGQNKEVLLSLSESPWIGEDEILTILENPKIAAKMVSKIADKPCWLRSYPIVLALIKHPKVPLKKAPGFLKRLRREDLKEIVIIRRIDPEVLAIADNIFEKTILRK